MSIKWDDNPRYANIGYFVLLDGAIRRQKSGALPPTSFLIEISYLLKENILMRGKFSDLKSLISALVVA